MLGEFMALHAQGNSLAGSSTSSGSSSGQAAHGSDKSSADTSQTPTDLTSKENGVTQEQIANEAYEDASVAPPKKEKKRVRYLRDSERHNIIKRIENGEKQASLAREYGVTRAAICHIKKNREEIITRYDSLLKQAQEIDRAENFTDSPGDEVTVREIRSNSVLLLMTTLRDRRSGPATFRRAAGRLIMCVHAALQSWWCIANLA
jgi:DNA-binding XRE family transcriptional regulator